MGQRRYSYKSERVYYEQRWPVEAAPYENLEPYLRGWLDPDAAFHGKRVLDIGAGECTYTRLIADRYRPRLVVACDLFPQRLLPAFRANLNPLLKFVAGDCFQLGFTDKSFDVVFGSLILHQLANLDDAAAEIRRVTADGGCYVGIEPNPYHPVHLYRYLRGRRSLNQYLLGPKDLAAFKNVGFKVKVRYFYAKLPWAGNRFLGTCMGIIAD